MEPDKQPPRRMMDMGPRRSMDMASRRPQTVQPPAADPQPVTRTRPITPRPVAQAPMPPPRAAQRTAPHAPQQRPASRQTPREAPAAQPVAPKPTGGGWRTVLQVIIGLVVIAAVASAIVVLYIKYYQ